MKRTLLSTPPTTQPASCRLAVGLLLLLLAAVGPNRCTNALDELESLAAKIRSELGPEGLAAIGASGASSATGNQAMPSTLTSVANDQQQQQEAVYAANQSASQTNRSQAAIVKCSRQSIILTRQALVHQLDTMNNYNSIWFNDLDRDELIEGQKHSLGNIVMAGLGQQLLHGDGQPLFEIEASYFRSAPSVGVVGSSLPTPTPLSIRLTRRHPDRCYLNREKGQFNYLFGLTIGPIEHNLDLVYKLPKELRLSQPTDWRYAQVRLLVPRMFYEVSVKQQADYRLDSSAAITSATSGGCPLEVVDVTYQASGKPQVAIVASGLANTNQTALHLERLFNDYTRPTVSSRLRQVLKFYLNNKTFPLSALETATVVARK